MTRLLWHYYKIKGLGTEDGTVKISHTLKPLNRIACFLCMLLIWIIIFDQIIKYVFSFVIDM